MRELRDSSDIEVPPERVWAWIEGLADNYTSWHPAHVSAEWERGAPNEVGSVLRAVEDLGGHREELRFELTAVEPPRRLDYRLLGPISLLLPRGSFTVIPTTAGSRFVAAISYRFGRLTELLFRGRTAALRAHMREEGESLKLIFEGERRSGPCPDA